METESPSISHGIAHRLEQMILEGTLAPLQKIPSERQLAAKFGVSRAIVRESLHELQGRGLIETRHGQGSFVTDFVPEESDAGPLMQLYFGHRRTLYDLYEVRELLEGQAAFLAAERGTEKDFHNITKAFNAMEGADPTNRTELDHAFHIAIVEASHNPVLVHTLNSLRTLILHTVHASVINLSHQAEAMQQIEKHHRQIYTAIMARQPLWAKKAAKAHVKNVCERLRVMEEENQTVMREAVKSSEDKGAATSS